MLFIQLRTILLWPSSLGLPALRWPTFPKQLFSTDQPRGSAAVLDIHHPVLHLYEEHIKNVASPKVSAHLFDWAQDDPLTPERPLWPTTPGAPDS